MGEIDKDRAELIPLKMGGSSPTVGPKAVLEAAGVVFPGLAEDHPDEQYVYLPLGWRITPDDFYHPEYPWVFYLRDVAGNVRAIIDHSGEYDLFLLSRFFTLRNTLLWEEEGLAVVDIIDSTLGHGGEIIHTTEPLVPEGKEEPESVFKRAKEKAITWLKQNYPDWQNPNAYWEQPKNNLQFIANLKVGFFLNWGNYKDRRDWLDFAIYDSIHSNDRITKQIARIARENPANAGLSLTWLKRNKELLSWKF